MIHKYDRTNANIYRSNKQASAPQQPNPTQYNSTGYPAAPSPNALYSGQYMVDAGVQNIIGKSSLSIHFCFRFHGSSRSWSIG